MESVSHLLFDFLISKEIPESSATYINMLALLIAAFIILYIIDFILRKVIIAWFTAISERSKTNFDNLLVKNRAPRNIAHVIPIIIADKLLTTVFVDFPLIENFVDKALEVFFILLVLWIVRSLLNTFKDYFKTRPRLKDKPVDSFIQVFMIFAWVIGLLYAFAVIAETEVTTFLATLGAASAVILLIFKDTILGFVASIQVSINDMVRIGDWITFQKFGADGDVIEINLATVKVQNFDKTITTIPTYALISDSFQNWRGMEESGGRRIKRAMIIKQESVKYLTSSEVVNLQKIELISSYLINRQDDINNYNQEHNINKEIAINGRNLTNIGVFRKYMETYAKNHSAINSDMMIMARQLAPTSQGIPIEIYAFSADKRWENYEYIMADVFDHLLAALPYFDLELFELPSSTNFRNK
ncbi:MAG: mechanosensitive ion channel [Flavobacteriaceae bacterium]|nr:mechanosensitive ion channel [Flavobacteriaceae bacterium]